MTGLYAGVQQYLERRGPCVVLDEGRKPVKRAAERRAGRPEQRVHYGAVFEQAVRIKRQRLASKLLPAPLVAPHTMTVRASRTGSPAPLMIGSTKQGADRIGAGIEIGMEIRRGQ